MHELKKHASEGDDIKFTIVKQSSEAFPTHIHHEMTRWDMLDAVFKAISDDPIPCEEQPWGIRLRGIGDHERADHERFRRVGHGNRDRGGRAWVPHPPR